jgi:hypothetical protein
VTSASFASIWPTTYRSVARPALRIVANAARARALAATTCRRVYGASACQRTRRCKIGERLWHHQSSLRIAAHMGINCSSASPADDDDESTANYAAQAAQVPQQNSAAPVFLNPHPRVARVPMTDLRRRRSARESDQYDLVDPLNDIAGKRLRGDPEKPRLRSKSKSPRLLPNGDYEDVAAYKAAREQVLKFEGALSYDYNCRISASQTERLANVILLKVRERDIKDVYEAAPPRRGYGGQLHPRFFGDHFLSNVDLIEKSHLYRIVCRMPKGAHLHIHFNANLLPNVLIDIAKDMDRMFITSDIPLVPGGDSDAFDRCKIQFSILSKEAVETQGGEKSIFTQDYESRKPMPFKKFLAEFGDQFRAAHPVENSNGNSPVDGRPRIEDVDVDKWLGYKLVFHEEEAHNFLQTSDG